MQTAARASGSVLSADGTTIGWRTSGSGRPAVLLHGTSSDKTAWSAALPWLQPELTVHAVDRRGRGRSGLGEPYAFEREIEDLAAVVDAIGEPCHLVGHSFGAVVAAAAIVAGVPARSVVLYEPPVLAWTAMDTPSLLAECTAAIERGAPEDCAAAFLREGGMAEELPLLRRIPAVWDQLLRDAHTIPREIHATATWTPGMAAGVTAPTMLLLGSRNVGHPLYGASVEAMAAVLPHAELRLLDGQAHLANAYAPELYAKTILEFVRRH